MVEIDGLLDFVFKLNGACKVLLFLYQIPLFSTETCEILGCQFLDR